MSERRRLPGMGFLIVLLFIAVPLAGTAIWLYKPSPSGPPPGPALEDLDVVCSGRVDGLIPSASLSPSLPGRVQAIEVKEGEDVPEGKVLLRLEDSAARLRVEEANAALAAANVDLDAAKADEKLQAGRIDAETALVAAATARVDAARLLQAQRKAQQSVTKITPVELAAGEAEVRQLEQLEAAEKQRLKELKAADPTLKIRAAQARLETAEVAVRGAKKAVEDCVLKAPTAGTVLRVQTSVGEAVTPGGLQPTPPIIFRPAGPLVVRAELEQEYLGRVKPGMKATIKDETRPDSPTWIGKLARVSDWVARRRSIVLEPGELNDVRTAECLVTVDPSSETLLVGQRVRVRFIRGEK